MASSGTLFESGILSSFSAIVGPPSASYTSQNLGSCQTRIGQFSLNSNCVRDTTASPSQKQAVHLYRKQSLTHHIMCKLEKEVLNFPKPEKVPTIQNTKSNKPLVGLVAECLFELLTVCRHHSNEGRLVEGNLAQIRASIEFANFEQHAQSIFCADFLIPEVEKLPFFLNLHNLILLHALITFGQPSGVSKLAFLSHKASYAISGITLSVLEIEHAILRSKSDHSKSGRFLPRFQEDDPRYILALETYDPRINFALNWGTNNCGAARIYTLKNIEQQLNDVTVEVLDRVLFIHSERRTVVLPKIMEWYKEDFGQTKKQMFEWVYKHLTSSQEIIVRESLRAVIRHESHFSMEFKAFSFDVSYYIPKKLF